MKYIIRFLDNHFTVSSFLIAGVAEVSLVVWAEKYNGRAVLDDVLKGNRSAVYGAFASIFGSLLGFVITAVSIVLGFSTSERLAIVRNSRHYSALWAAFTHTIKVLGLATIISLAALIIDRDSKPFWISTYAIFLMIMLSVLLISRSIWALERVIKLIAPPPKSAKST